MQPRPGQFYPPSLSVLAIVARVGGGGGGWLHGSPGFIVNTKYGQHSEGKTEIMQGKKRKLNL